MSRVEKRFNAAGFVRKDLATSILARLVWEAEVAREERKVIVKTACGTHLRMNIPIAI
jgi:hypothetical protein